MNRKTIFYLVLTICSFKCFSQYIIVGDTTSSGIIYYNIKDTVVPSVPIVSSYTTFIDIDIDKDNINDVRFIRTYYYMSPGGHSQSNKQLVQSLNNIEFDTLTSNNLSCADSVGYNAVLDNSYNWTSSTTSLYLRFWAFSIPNYYTIAGVFYGENKYLGFRKILPYDTLYGWFLLDVQSGIVIKSWAYKSLYASINEKQYHNENIFVYPNPASDKLFLQNLNEGIVIKKHYLTDILGRETQLKQTDNEFDISHLPEGLYFLQLQTTQGVLTKKIVIQH